MQVLSLGLGTYLNDSEGEEKLQDSLKGLDSISRSIPDLCL